MAGLQEFIGYTYLDQVSQQTSANLTKMDSLIQKMTDNTNAVKNSGITYTKSSQTVQYTDGGSATVNFGTGVVSSGKKIKVLTEGSIKISCTATLTSGTNTTFVLHGLLNGADSVTGTSVSLGQAGANGVAVATFSSVHKGDVLEFAGTSSSGLGCTVTLSNFQIMYDEQTGTVFSVT